MLGAEIANIQKHTNQFTKKEDKCKKDTEYSASTLQDNNNLYDVKKIIPEDPKSQKEVADKLGISIDSIQQAKVVKNNGRV